MADVLQMPRVTECAVNSCAYNHDGCHAFAITIESDAATCGTFFDVPTKGGVGPIAQVGACQQTTCRHNESLECHAPAIQVASNGHIADCQTFSAR